MKASGPSTPTENLLDPSATAEREARVQATHAAPRSGGGGSPSTKVPERDPGLVSMMRGGAPTRAYGGMDLVNGGAAAPSNTPLKSQPEPETPKAKPRYFGMER